MTYSPRRPRLRLSTGDWSGGSTNRDGFAVTFGTYYEDVAAPGPTPAAYADALHRLHAGMRDLEVTTPQFTERIAEAERLLA
ncbi:MAG TPA: hypothetical protein VM121_09475, partial [Acidimicrobiales bacterium]|nr:hypothetical protein [Acidimicrobiales bacterium]